MTNLIPVEDQATLARLNGETSQQPTEQKSTFLGGTKENWMDQIPSSLAAIGGVGGAALGAAAGMGPGSVPGMIAGGALGSGGGQYAGDVILNALKSMGVYEGGQQRGVGEMTKRAGETAAFDAAAGMGAPVLGKMYQGAKSAALGVGEQGLRAYREAADQGINLGLSDVAGRSLPRLYEKVIGSFPVMGGPLRKAFDRKIGEVEAATGRAVESIGQSRGTAESGRELTDAARAEFEKFRVLRDDKYDRARQAAASATMGTDNLRKQASDIVAEWDSQAVAGLSRNEPEIVSKAREFANAPDTVTFPQYEGMAGELDRLMDKARTEGYRIKQGTNVANALREDVQTLSDKRALDFWNEAETFFKENHPRFDTTTAQQFGRVDRNIFRAGREKAGSVNADEVFSKAFDAKSPIAMRELRDVVGPEAFSNALATHLDNVIQKSMTEQVVKGDAKQVISAAALSRNLGFDNPKSPQFASLQAAFNLADRPDGVRALKQLVDAAAKATDRGAPNVSQFLARRGVMGGMGALESALPVGAALGAASSGGNPLVPLMGFLAANRLSNRLADPKFLREMAVILDPKTPEELRDAVWKRVFPAQIITKGVPNPVEQYGR